MTKTLDSFNETMDDLEKIFFGISDERDRYRAALERIASFDDHGANARLEATGSYALFDEPGSVEIARAAIAKVRA